MSVPQMEETAIRTSTCSGPGSGSANSRTSSWRFPVKTTPFIACRVADPAPACRNVHAAGEPGIGSGGAGQPQRTVSGEGIGGAPYPARAGLVPAADT